MPTIFYAAIMVVCFQGDCTKFESTPYKKDISADFCQKMLTHMFQTQVGPYFDDIIDIEQSTPEDLTIQYAGCDVTDRNPEDGSDWNISPDIDKKLIPDQNDIEWQQQKGREI